MRPVSHADAADRAPLHRRLHITPGTALRVSASATAPSPAQCAPHRRPLKRRGGSAPPSSPASISPSFMQQVLAVPTARGGLGSHTRRSRLRVCACARFACPGRHFWHLSAPVSVSFLLDRACIPPIYADFHATGRALAVLVSERYTNRYTRIEPPIHVRYTPDCGQPVRLDPLSSP